MTNKPNFTAADMIAVRNLVNSLLDKLDECVLDIALDIAERELPNTTDAESETLTDYAELTIMPILTDMILQGMRRGN